MSDVDRALLGAHGRELRGVRAAGRGAGDRRDLTATPPGLLDDELRTAGLLRDSVPTLAPRPDLSAVFPLPFDTVAGSADPDTSVWGDTSRPLVFNQVEQGCVGNSLKLYKAEATPRLRFTW